MSSIDITVCLLNARGDQLLNLPAIRALRASTDGSFALVLRPGAYAAFFRDVEADTVVEVDASFEGDGYHLTDVELRRAIRAIGATETFVSLNPWLTPSLARLVEGLAPKEAVGLGEGPWTDPVPLDFGQHSSELAFSVIRRLHPEAAIDRFSHPPYLPSEAMEAGRLLRDELLEGRLIALHTDTKPPKEWPAERWVSVVEQWLHQHPDDLVIDVGLSSLPVPSWMERHLLTGLRLSLEVAMAVVGQADLFLGVDSCFLHTADLFRVPAVGVFTITSPEEFGIRWGPGRHVSGPAAEASATSVVAAAGELILPAAAEPISSPGVSLSPIGWGTAGVSEAVEVECARILTRLLPCGVNVVDVAGNHGLGGACSIVGRAMLRAELEGLARRSDLFICGKAGFTEHLHPGHPTRALGWVEGDHSLDPRYIRWELDRQLRALRTSYLDAFLLQNPEEAFDRGWSRAQVLEAVTIAFAVLEEEIRLGRLHRTGVSTADALVQPPGHAHQLDLADLEGAARDASGVDHHFSVIELPVSLARLDAATEASHRSGDPGELRSALSWAADREMVVLASAALNAGKQIQQLGMALANIVDVTDPAAAALAFVGTLPGVTCALVGVTSGAHVDSVTRALRLVRTQSADWLGA